MKARIMGRTVDLGKSNLTPSVQPVIQSVLRPGWPKETDKWNYSYAQFLELERQAARVLHWWYEPLSIWLPGQVRYKPDFMIQRVGRSMLELVEVKGWSRNLRDGMTRYKIAASLFPCFTWKMVKRKGHGWEEFS